MRYLHNAHYTRLPAELLTWVIGYYKSDDKRAYHNWRHIERVYDWTNEWKYDYDLSYDLAVAFHDIVYDDKQDKEIRSALVMQEVVPRFISNITEEILAKATSLVLSTISHKPCEDNRLILTDLADLSVEFFRTLNFQNIKIESRKLYGITSEEFNKNTIKYMRQLRNNLEDGQDFWKDDKQKFVAILKGITNQIADIQINM